MLWGWTSLRWGVLDTTLCDKVSQWQVSDFLWVLWFPPTNKTDCLNITGILLKVALNTINPNPIHTFESRIFVLMKSVCMFSSVHQNITYVTPRGEVPPHGEQINVMLEKTEGTVKNWQSRDTGNNWHTRHRAKTNKTQKHSIAQKAKKTSNTEDIWPVVIHLFIHNFSMPMFVLFYGANGQ